MKKSIKFKWPHLSRDTNSSSLKQQVSVAHSQWRWQDETFTNFKHLDNGRGCHTWLMLVKSTRNQWSLSKYEEALHTHKQSSWTAVNISHLQWNFWTTAHLLVYDFCQFFVNWRWGGAWFVLMHYKKNQFYFIHWKNVIKSYWSTLIPYVWEILMYIFRMEIIWWK